MTDLSGSENHALVNGKGGEAVDAPAPEIVESKYGTALRFSGQNWLEVVDAESLCITDALTMLAWVKPESEGGEQTICTKDRGYYLQLQSGKIGNYTYDLSVPGYHESPDAIPVDEWSHIGMSWDGSELVQYLNGDEVNRVNTQGEIATTDDSLGIGAEVRIPSRGQPEWRFFMGSIDDLVIIPAGRTQDEVQAIMAGGFLAVGDGHLLPTFWAQLKRGG